MTKREEVTSNGWYFIDEDEVLGLRTVMRYDNATGTLTVREESMYLQGILDYNAEARAHNQGGKWGDGRVYARVPIHLAGRELDEAFANHDWRYIKKWMNDPDHARFRTFEGSL